MKKIYIVLSHSGSIPSRIIKMFTHYKYSHVAISFDKDLETMYSFGRKKVNRPFDGGFIIEHKLSDFYQKFNKTNIIVLEISVSNLNYIKLLNKIKKYKIHKELYKYDILGLIPRFFNIKIERKYHNNCSEFVGRVLEESNIYKFNKSVIKPKDFMKIPNKKIIYKGLLFNY
ncbi:MAG: hypothetical protein IJD92_00065 [Bacilli bacterium]|nr:hypothetical protein [Bacilli bacterium]